MGLISQKNKQKHLRTVKCYNMLISYFPSSLPLSSIKWVIWILQDIFKLPFNNQYCLINTLLRITLTQNIFENICQRQVDICFHFHVYWHMMWTVQQFSKELCCLNLYCFRHKELQSILNFYTLYSSRLLVFSTIFHLYYLIKHFP